MTAIKDQHGGIFKFEDSKSVKIVFTDLDGTLLNSKSELSNTNLESLRKAKKNGVIVSFATGRTLFSTKKLIGKEVLEKYDLSLFPGVYLNGCVAFDERGSFLINKKIDENVKMEIFYFLKQQNIMKRVLWYDDAKNYCVEHNEYTTSVTKVKETLPALIDEDKIKDIVVYKVCLCLDPERVKEMYELCKKKFSNQLSIRNSLQSYVEMFDSTANKLEGIKKICESYNTSVDHALACGDGDNDVEMLKGVKYSVAVGNASKDVKEAAKYVGPRNDENAVSHILQAFNCI